MVAEAVFLGKSYLNFDITLDMLKNLIAASCSLIVNVLSDNLFVISDILS